MEIIANGSKWAGQELDSFATLLDVLASHTLDPTFEDYGNFYYQLEDGRWRLFGNFFGLSHVFDIIGAEDELRPAVELVRANQSTPAYREALRVVAARAEARRLANV